MLRILQVSVQPFDSIDIGVLHNVGGIDARLEACVEAQLNHFGCRQSRRTTSAIEGQYNDFAFLVGAASSQSRRTTSAIEGVQVRPSWDENDELPPRSQHWNHR